MPIRKRHRPHGITGATGPDGVIGVYPVEVIIEDNILSIALSDSTTYVVGAIPSVNAGDIGATRYPTEVPFQPGDPTGMNVLYNVTTGSAGYSQYTRTALTVAARNGVTEANASFAWIDNQFTIHLRSGWGPAWGWMIT